MCLEVLVQLEPSAKAAISPPSLRAASGLAIREVKFEGRTAFHFSTDGTCSCGFLAAGCEPEGELWTFNEDASELLARVIEALAAKGRNFDFLAHWPGAERPRRIEKVSAESLARTMRLNAVRNNLLFQVRT